MSVAAPDLMLAEARLARPPAELFLRLSQAPGLGRELRHFRQFLAVDKAHTAMLVEQGILARAHGRAILDVLVEIETEGPAGLAVDAHRGSLLLQVEARLAERLGEAVGGRMHTGRSRIDQGATVRRLFKRGRMLDAMARLLALETTLLAQAGRHRRTLMPGYTHLQHAQPWVFGHYLHSFFVKFREDFDRLTESYRRVNRNPLGTVGLSGTSWPLDRERTTALLGFSGLVENSKLGREAYYAAEAATALAFVMADLNDLACDLHLWSSHEFGLVESDDAFCGTSSIFPQKKNPAALETIKKAAGGATQWPAEALATFRGEGTGDQAIRELSMIDRAFDTVCDMLELAEAVVATLIVHEGRMRELAQANWSTASNLADVLVRDRGLSYRQSHHVVGRLVRTCLEQGVRPEAATGALLDRAAAETIGRGLDLDDAAVRDALDADRFVATRITTGSIGPAEVDRMLTEAAGERDAMAGWLAAERGRLAAADRALAAAVAAIREVGG
ncbi:argininosuccinate lyase [Stella sp.]|uniref:argininosuccinate lyase n=1 Tax=Stella sp. TaxID=2912054 RepID=UPI0035AE9DA6